VLGVGYAALAAAIFVGSAVRQVGVERALDRHEYRSVSEWSVIALTLVAAALALGTLVIIIVQP
jgi:uncharacterized membrane protein YidH (DUF202 family)